ncbi:MAG: DUF4062 domain-containing protein [Halobacteriota archaeon]|jgi:WD40 repeat protein
MSLSWQTVSVFVSSTFNDMHAERDYLVKRVFTELREWCEQRKLHLIDIDLRWGITEADAMNKNAVKVCLNRIDECRPFFLCFLGQRRGWVPKKDEIDPDTCTAFPDLKNYIGAASITEMEILHAVIDPMNKKERADRSFFYLRDPSYLKDLPDEPEFIRNTYTNEGIANPIDRERADEELRDLREVIIPKTHRPVHHYTAKWNPNETTQELAIPLQCPSGEIRNQKRWKNHWRVLGTDPTTFDLNDDEMLAEEARKKNQEIIRGRLGSFRCDNEDLAKVIFDDLTKAISERFPEHLVDRAETPLQKELDQQERFLELNCNGFIRREGDFDALNAYAASDSRDLFVLTAPGGMGKTMLLANWIRSYQQQHGQDLPIFYRFIGASDGSTTVNAVLRSVLAEINEANLIQDEIPFDPTELRNKFPDLLKLIGTQGQCMIVIDALNQLESGLRNLYWLPKKLPAGIKMIVSFKRDGDEAEQLASNLRKSLPRTYYEIKPFATRDDRKKLVTAYLDQYLKQLDDTLIEALIERPEAQNPLFLKVVLSELRIYGSFANLGKKIREDFGTTPAEAFVAVLRRLEDDPIYSSVEPKISVPLIFGLLAHARQGLAEEELVGLFIQELCAHEKIKCETNDLRYSYTDTIRLILRQVRQYLASRQGRYDFFYEGFKEAAMVTYQQLKKETNSEHSGSGWHDILASFFIAMPTWLTQIKSDTRPTIESRVPNYRKCIELPYQLTKAGRNSELEDILTNISFIEAKATSLNIDDLLLDYQRLCYGRIDPRSPVCTCWYDDEKYGFFCPFCHTWNTISNKLLGTMVSCPICGKSVLINLFVLKSSHKLNDISIEPILQQIPKYENVSPKLIEFFEFVRNQTHILSQHPSQTFDQALNWLNDTAPNKNAKAIYAHKTPKKPWIRWINREDSLDPRITTIPVDTEKFDACLFTPEGYHFVTLTDGKTVRVWDARTCTEIEKIRLANENATSIAFSPNCEDLIIGYEDGRIEARCMTYLDGDPEYFFDDGSSEIHYCKFSADGKFFVTHSLAEIKIWETKNRTKARALGHANLCALDPSGKYIATILKNNDIVIRDLDSGDEVNSEQHNTSDKITHCEFSPDGNWLCFLEVIGLDGYFLIKDVKNLNQLHRLYACGIRKFVFSPNGQFLALPHSNGYIYIYDLDSRALKLCEGETNRYFFGISHALKTTLSGHHPDDIDILSFSPDGEHLLSASGNEHTIKIWDLPSAFAFKVTTPRMASGVNRLLFSPDGRKIIVASSHTETLVLDAKDGRILQSYVIVHGSWPYHMHDAVLTPNSQQVVGGSNGFVLFMNTEIESYYTKSFKGLVYQCLFTPTGHILILLIDGKLEFYDKNGVFLRNLQLKDGSGEVIRFALSPNGSEIIIATKDNNLGCYFVENGKVKWIAKENRHNSVIQTLSFSPDGNNFVSTSDRQLCIYNANSGIIIKTFSMKDDITSFSSCPDGLTFAFASNDKIFVCNWKTGLLRKKFAPHDDEVTGCAFSSDCRYLITISSDCTLKTWDTNEWNLLATFVGMFLPFTACSHSNLDKFAASDKDGAIYVLTLENYTQGPTFVPVWHSIRDNTHSILCPKCQNWTIISNTLIGSKMDCPVCKRNLQLSGFILEGEWKEIEKAQTDESIVNMKNGE